MDSSRRSYLIAAAVIVAAMIAALFVVGVPGCGGGESSTNAPIRTTSSSDTPDVPQDANPGEGGIDVDEEEYGDTGPQDAGPLQMAAVSNTGAVVIYDLPEIRQVAYNTKTKDVSGVVSLAPASRSPSVNESIQYMTARNPASRFSRSQKTRVQVAGVPGYQVSQEVGPPMSSYGVSTIAKVKNQILTVTATGPIRKKDTIAALHRKLVKAVRVGAISAADQERAEQRADGAAGSGADGGTDGSSGSTGGSTGGSAGSESGGSAGGSSGGDIPIPRAPTKTTTAPPKKEPSRPVAGR